MNRYMKAALAIAAALVLCLTLIGCSLVSVNEDKDNAQIVAKVGDLTVTKGDYKEAFNQMLSYYSYFGQDPTSSADQLKSFQDNVLDSLIQTKVEEYQAKKQGFAAPNAEDQKKIDDEVDKYMTQWGDAAKSQAEAEKASDSSISVDKRTNEIFKDTVKQAIGKEMDQATTKKWLIDYFTPQYLIDEYKASFDSKITVTDDDVKAAFDKKLASDKTALTATPSSFSSEQISYEQYLADQANPDSSTDTSTVTLPPLFVPEGYARVRIIKSTPDAELGTDYTDKTAQMADLEAQIGKLSTTPDEQTANAAKIADLQSQYSAARAEAEKLKSDVFAPAKAKIDEAYGKLTGGTSFDEVLKTYTKDSDFTSETGPFFKTGIPFYTKADKEDTTWSDSIKAAVAALTAPGSYTGVLSDDSAYYIIQYVGPEAAGERKLEDYKDIFHKSTLTAKQSDEWNAAVSEWTKDTTVVTKYDNLIRDVGQSAAQ